MDSDTISKEAYVRPNGDKALGMYESVVRIGRDEEQIYFLSLEGRISRGIHRSHGREACAAGILHDNRVTGSVASTHRPAGYDLTNNLSSESMMFEMSGGVHDRHRDKNGGSSIG